MIGLGYVNTYPADMKAALIMMSAGAAGAFTGAAFTGGDLWEYYDLTNNLFFQKI